MGCFSFICKESGLPVASSSFDGDAVRLYLLENGKVIEEMKGHYDSYGRVFDGQGGSFEWKKDWGEIVDSMFNGKDGDGIAAVLECHFNGTIPTTQSEGDPDQGWGEDNGHDFVIDEPYHKIYKDE
jgi:hypothetical protein